MSVLRHVKSKTRISVCFHFEAKSITRIEPSTSVCRQCAKLKRKSRMLQFLNLGNCPAVCPTLPCQCRDTLDGHFCSHRLFFQGLLFSSYSIHIHLHICIIGSVNTLQDLLNHNLLNCHNFLRFPRINILLLSCSQGKYRIYIVLVTLKSSYMV